MTWHENSKSRLNPLNSHFACNWISICPKHNISALKVRPLSSTLLYAQYISISIALFFPYSSLPLSSVSLTLALYQVFPHRFLSNFHFFLSISSAFSLICDFICRIQTWKEVNPSRMPRAPSTLFSFRLFRSRVLGPQIVMCIYVSYYLTFTFYFLVRL